MELLSMATLTVVLQNPLSITFTSLHAYRYIVTVSYVSRMPPLRLRQVSGDESRVNDTLFQPAATRGAKGKETLVFFGGDVQDYPEIMEVHRDNRNYLKWNLESTARMLGNNFPDKHILVVRPSRIEYKSFSCYDNFVSSNEAGVPEHEAHPRALPHLDRLLQNVSIRLNAMPASELMEAITSATPEDADIEEGLGPPHIFARMLSEPAEEPYRDVDPLWWRESLALHEGSLSLVGFSKGCVVLNQIVHEFHYTQTQAPGDEHMTRLVRGVRELFWLDGGHAGGRGAWLTARPPLAALAATGIKIYIHVSPYQVEDESRPWIGREEKIFTSSLKKLGAKVLRWRHAAGGPASLHTHFALLGNFKRLQDSVLAHQE